MLKEKHDIHVTLNTVTCGSARSCWSSITTTFEYQTQVASTYINALLESIKNRFTEKTVKIIIAMSIFNFSLLPTVDLLQSYGN